MKNHSNGLQNIREEAQDGHRFYQTRSSHWDSVAQTGNPPGHGWGGAYRSRLSEVYRFLIPPVPRFWNWDAARETCSLPSVPPGG